MAMSVEPQLEPIAIIGTACRFPGGVNSPSSLWNLLRHPRHLAERIPLDRFNVDGFYHKSGQYHGHFNVKEGYFLSGDGVCRQFDGSFFGMSPAEAMCLDPLSRLLLETVYEALEISGLTIESLRGSDTAVYTGQMVYDYNLLAARDNDMCIGTYHASGTSHAVLSNRVSYFFDWHGPSMTIDTACSSSLVAFHHAVQQLRSGLSRVAIATGANLLLDPSLFISLSKLNMLSPNGRSRMWDADADGYARGEGIAAIVMKTLSAALEDGDDIECIIRETGFGQDVDILIISRPNAAAQVNLIHGCYRRAGLNPADPADQPQYFECHGTGTQAGDLAEAEAISTVFSLATDRNMQPLFVGSIKSVIGHTEGTAGLAGVLKASLALQNAAIPPNLLFTRLNPRVEPFCTNIHLPTILTPWPSPPNGNPRRASVNSFGFAGANVHVILESYTAAHSICSDIESEPSALFTPFVFSASTKASLYAYLLGFRDYLSKSLTTLSLQDLAYTLHSRRSLLNFNIAITAADASDLCTEIDKKVQAARDENAQSTAVRVMRHHGVGKSSILGVFTGQGAQWAGMGCPLITSSAATRQIIERLDLRLSQLPDGPSWSLMEELQKDPSSSRISEALLSQPCCTAMQILQVDLLRAAGVEFTSVVGHSSGEIAAAYAAGLISAEDAICIAYYRGLHSNLSSGQGRHGKGAMLAVGTSADDAQEICDEPEFKGRVCVGAINSPSSITLSGDADAIDELEVIFQDEGKFVRRLRVDMAYHSHHMLPCSGPYLSSLCDLKIEVGQSSTTWISSVYGCQKHTVDSPATKDLEGQYWVRNMVQPVLFQQAIESAHRDGGRFDLAIELGPHPALKGPVLQSLHELPYTGLSKRGQSAVTSMSEALGYVWEHLGTNGVTLDNYERFVSGRSGPRRLLKGLPSYAWDHNIEYWYESRYSMAVRQRLGPVHELLGHLTPDSTDQEMRWRHILQPIEIPWLMCHRLQGQIVFPAAGYVSTAIEAAMAICKHRGFSPALIELLDFKIDRALVFENDNSNVEIIISATDISLTGETTLEANFKYYSADGAVSRSLCLSASGRLQIMLGEACMDALPGRCPRPPYLTKVLESDFYSSSRALGYHWSGPFITLDRCSRKLGASTGFLKIAEPSGLIISPAVLDGAFQATLLAYSAPFDGQLWTIHVPGEIRRVIVNPFFCARAMTSDDPLPFDASHDPDMITLVSNAELYSSQDASIIIVQVDGLKCIPISPATADDDRETFATVNWGVLCPDIGAISCSNSIQPENHGLFHYLERMAGFYMRAFRRDINLDPDFVLPREFEDFFQFTTDMTLLQRAGHVPVWYPGWEQDTQEEIRLAGKPYENMVEVQLLRAVGESLVDAVRSKTSVSEVLMRDGILRRFYDSALGPRMYTETLAEVVKQISHRTPHLKIIEIGTGTGAAAGQVLAHLEPTAFASYTLTDISATLLESARPSTMPYPNKVLFKLLDINRDPTSQDFSEQSYDVLVAAFTLHSSPGLERTLRHARRLLRPGGYLVALELLPTTSSVYGLLFGTLPGWLRKREGRTALPAISLAEWDKILRKSGFSGCDTTTQPHEDNCGSHFAIFVSQAINEKLAFIRSPLTSQSFGIFHSGSLIPHLVILSGDTSRLAELGEETKSLLQHHCGRISIALTLSDVVYAGFSPRTSILSIADIEDPLFHQLDNSKWDALKRILLTVGNVVWVTRGRRANNPYSNMMLGLLRSVVREAPTLNYRTLDFEDEQGINAHALAEAMLKFQAESLWRREDRLSTTVENELVMDKAGRLIIPRLIPNKRMNQRFNSSKRQILHNFDPNMQRISVFYSADNSCYKLRQEFPLGVEDGYVITTESSIDVTYSVLSAVHVHEHGSLFVTLGKHRALGHQIISLSANHASVISPVHDLWVEVDIPQGAEPIFLSLVVYHLLVFNIMEGLVADETVLVFGTDTVLGKVIAKEAAIQGVHVSYLTTPHGKTSGGLNWIRSHPFLSDCELSKLLPSKTSVFIDLSTSKTGDLDCNRIRRLLPAHCRHYTTESLFSSAPLASSRECHIRSIRERLERAASRSLSSINDVEDSMPLPIQIRDLAISGHPSIPYSILDWTSLPQALALIQPIDIQIAFAASKTYWLAGLSGTLGVALCDWMFRRGARHFVISSRHPKIDKSWLEAMRRNGAAVKIASCDLCSKNQTKALHEEILSCMPPIAGVTQGANSWEDTAIKDMDFKTFMKGTRPKVDGSIFLSDLFRDNPLDFFIYFSSVVSIVGRPGQAYYSAANMFMAAMAEQRRRKGLAASVIHIGPIHGVGYVTEQEALLFQKEKLRSSALVAVSQREFYQLFAEAVIAGRLPGSSIELVDGVRRVSQDDPYQPFWEADPLMQHFIKPSDGNTPDVSSQSRVTMQTRLERATTQSDVYNILLDGLLPKICFIFQMDAGDIAGKELAEMRLNEMGIDSLSAVEIRTWFMRTLEVDIPVLKILSGTPIGDLVTLASEMIPLRFVPNLCSRQPEHMTRDSGLSTLKSSHENFENELNPDSSSSSRTSANLSSETSQEDLAQCSPSILQRNQDQHDLKKIFDLSFGQGMFWFVWRMLKDKTSLNHTALARITGNIRIPELEQTFREVCRRHESLRTRFFEANGHPLQAIMETSMAEFEAIKIESEEEVQAALQVLQNEHVYDLEAGRTLRVLLLSLTNMNHFLVAGLHPLIADGFSFQNLLKELHISYIQPRQSQQSPSRQFTWFSEKQHADLAGGEFDGDLKFWRSEFKEFPEPLPILTVSKATSRPMILAYDNERAAIKVGIKTKDQVQGLCRHYNCTSFQFYLAVFRALILRYSPPGDGDDVVVGFGDANRTEDEMVDVIGPFVNLLPLRLRSSADTQFARLLTNTRDAAYRALEHSKVPFQALLNNLGVVRSASHTPLFQCFVNYRQGLHKTQQWGSAEAFTLHAIEIGIPRVAYDVSLEIVDYKNGDCLHTLVVRKDMYGADEVGYLIKSYELLIEAFLTDPTTPIYQPQIFESIEVERVLEFSRGPHMPPKWPPTIVHRINAIAEERPHAIAVQCDSQTSTYREVVGDARATAMALRAAQVTPGSPVAVLLESSVAWVSSLLGIMHIGAVYLPLDLGHPWGRLAAISHVFNLEQPGIQMINICNISKYNNEWIDISAREESPATILYTSGSSGLPKGILLQHKSLRNWAEPLSHIYGIGAETVLQQTSWTFDVSLAQLLSALCFGGRLFLVPYKQRHDAHLISNLISSKDITVTYSTPSEYSSWFRFGRNELNNAKTWKIAFSGGEQLPNSLVKQFQSLSRATMRFYSLYGPTECGTNATGMEISLDDHYTIAGAGSPRPNYSVYVVDERLRLVAAGVQGEIYIGGASVGLGYVNQPELTRERFVADVLASPEDRLNGHLVLHRTGDLGRWQKNGVLLVEGRIGGDTQIKIRGLRVDIAEVEHVMLNEANDILQAAIVSVRQSPSADHQILVAHVVFANAYKSLADYIGKIQALLAKKLPLYMRPAVIIPLPSIPITSTGKVDRRAVAALELPEADKTDTSHDDRDGANLSLTEETLRNIWFQVIPTLSVASQGPITRETDFFQVGGSSLLLLDLHASIQQAFPKVDISLASLFDSSTLSEMARYIEYGNSFRERESATVKWNAETAIPKAIINALHREAGSSQASKRERIVIVLTGATGQLGSELLNTLVTDARVKHVHCLGVRNAAKRLDRVNTERITLHEGDLTMPRLGLSEATARHLFGDIGVDVIIHAGADASYMKTYKSLRAANVQSTKELAILSNIGQRLPQFNYISTASLELFATASMEEVMHTSLTPPLASGFTPPAQVSPTSINNIGYGYISSKWASEAFLEQLHKHNPSWPIFIHRPTLIVPPVGETNVASHQGTENLGLNLHENLRYWVTKMHIVPKIPKVGAELSGALNLVPLDEVVRKLVRILFNDTVNNPGTEVCIIYHTGEAVLSLDELATWFRNDANIEFSELEMGEWATRAGGFGMHPTMVAMLQKLGMATEGRVVFPRLQDCAKSSEHMESCSVCRNLVPLPGPSGGFITGGEGIDLAKSTPNCQICSILWEGLSAFCVQNPEGVQWMALNQDEGAFRLQYRHLEDRRWMGLHFYTRNAESPLSDIFEPGSDLELDTACEKYLAQAKSWVRDCCEKHDDCKDRLSTVLPTRVLDLARDEGFVFLCEPEETQTGSYVALSHVWGGEVPIRTTTETLDLFKDGIRLDSLPQTFRDAVFMARLLECPYLWIDSLCIIQDSKEDWTREAARMADAYGNAYVTIAAVAAENSNSGLFSKHEASVAKHTIQRAGESGRDMIVDVRPALEHTPYYESSPYGLPQGTEARLLGRAWCFQEYLLSPRVLLFTDWEILWVCLSRRECNCGHISRDSRDINPESDLKIRFDKTLRSGSVRQLHRLWMDIVNRYSLKDMTYATDKLPALAGIAYLFSAKHLGRYVNGVWESTLIQDLFWEISWSFVEFNHIMVRRPEGLSMPSWSWASVAGPIDSSPVPDIEGLEIVEISFEPTKLGSLVDVSTRSITLHGILINARVWGGQKTGRDYVSPHRQLEADGITGASWLVDVPTEVNCGPGEPVNAHIFCGTKGPGLVVVPVQESSASFKRLGRIRGLPVQRGHYTTKSIQLV
ncbi:hypothetical protein NUW58_g3008 [Xylaria curta]|uniref:Uncharacterized protein n=1 Tax=Xylaria curta TaxID=42375 RepID=A0ACC1PEH6_9PEZI|nr:hypothetical protein NUW58_g3008 [Xylaria curta]